MHGERNYPFTKAISDLDIALPDETGDQDYLDKLDEALNTMFERFSPQLLIFLAGADPYEGDRLGRLSLSMEGMAARDAAVMQAAREHDLPVAIAMAGGYGRTIEDTVAVHTQTISIAFDHFRSRKSV
jgi:acetoin utilization deacetylase AcuC-like enzyme